VDATLVGTVCESFTMVVEVGKVREFARSANSTNPEYLARWDAVSPPTFLAAASFWMSPENSPTLQANLDFERILNGGQEFVFHGPPPRAGTGLTGTGRIAEVYEKTGKRGGVMTFMVVVYDYVDDDGALVAEVRSTIIETAQVVGS
jgi:N-terminal half of MaoC dehydratase